MRRGPGRPARLSRASILEAGLALLERAPAAPLTIARIAAEVDAVPAALYRHFAQLDELRDGVLGAVLAGMELELHGDTSWRARLRHWMTSVRAHLTRYPAVLPLLGRHGRTSPPWLDAVAVLVGVLERAGLTGAVLARTHLWIAETTVGMVMLEASLSVPAQIANARASLDELSPASRKRLAQVVPHLASIDGDAFFAFAVDRTIDAVATLVRQKRS